MTHSAVRQHEARPSGHTLCTASQCLKLQGLTTGLGGDWMGESGLDEDRGA